HGPEPAGVVNGRAIRLAEILRRHGQAMLGLDDRTGLFGELADQGLLFAFLTVDGAAGQVEIAALAAVNAHAGQLAALFDQTKSRDAVDVVEARSGRSKLKLHLRRLTRVQADAKGLKVEDQLRSHAGVVDVELDRRTQT